MPEDHGSQPPPIPPAPGQPAPPPPPGYSWGQTPPFGQPPSYPYPVPANPPVRSTNGFAVASLVLGILWIYGITSILALIFGLVARGQIARSRGWQTGDGLAIAGIVLGLVGIAGIVVLIIVAVSTAHFTY